MLSRFSRREKIMILTAAGFVGIGLLLQMLLFPAIDKRRNLKHQFRMKQEILSEMKSLRKRYEEISQTGMMQKQIIMKRKKSFTLFSFLDRLARKIGVKENVIYMKPSTRKSDGGSVTISNVKVKLDNLLMQQAVDFLYAIEMPGKAVHIPSLSLSHSGTDRKLTAVIETETILLNGS